MPQNAQHCSSAAVGVRLPVISDNALYVTIDISS